MRSLSSVALLVLLVASCRVNNEIGIREERRPRQLEDEPTALLSPKLGMAVRAGPKLPASECEGGQRRPCWPNGNGPSADPAANRRYQMVCRESWRGIWRWDRAACNTPLVVSFDEDAPITFTRPEASFTIGASSRTEWVSARTPWLALDRDGSGCVEGQQELFGPPENGDGTNGFAKLRQLDENHDGRIDEDDPAFASLVLWSDRDQDKRCVSSELTKLTDLGIVALDLGYAETPSASFGSYEGEHAAIWFRVPATGELRRGRLVDVYLSPM